MTSGAQCNYYCMIITGQLWLFMFKAPASIKSCVDLYYINNNINLLIILFRFIILLFFIIYLSYYVCLFLLRLNKHFKLLVALSS